MKNMTVSEFIQTKYRDYWNYNNSNGKNSIDPREQLPEVIRKIIYAAYRLNIRPHDEHKTTELMGETGKFHAHGPSSIEDSIKGVATAYKSQSAVRILEGVGNFGAAQGDEGSAGRYTSVCGTPLLDAIYRDIPFVPSNTDDTGLEQPDYISSPLPFTLINGSSAIGTGKSCYVAERKASEVIDWIEKMNDAGWDQGNFKDILPPDPMSVTECKTWYEPSNGYVYYDAVVHEGVDRDDLNQRGRFDIITNLPPKQTPENVIGKLQSKLPTRVTKRIIDGAGKGRPIYIIVPKGYLNEKDYMKYGMRTARKEQIYLWEHDLQTMKKGDIFEIAKEWFEDRCGVVKRRLESEISQFEARNHRYDLIKEYAEHGMTNWELEDIFAHFIALAGEGNSERGTEDANLVLSEPARSFLPESLGKNEIKRKSNDKNIKERRSKIKKIGKTVIEEARDIIQAQEKFFA